MSVKTSPGCAITGLILIGVFVLYTHYISDPAEEEKELNELKNKWGEETVNYFSNFSCSNIEYEQTYHKIDKFFVIESHLDHPCSLSIYSNTDSLFENQKSLGNDYSKDINLVNTIIWIQSVPGNVEATYNDGSQAKRLIAQINFIKKSTNKIYKTESIEFSGAPAGTITRYGRKSESKNVYFGKKPYEKIYQAILKEVELKYY